MPLLNKGAAPAAPTKEQVQAVVGRGGQSPAPKTDEAPKTAPKTDEASKTDAANTTGLSADFLSAPEILLDSPDLLKATAPRNARSDEQRAMDAVVATAHKTWIDAGKPDKWADLAAKRCVKSYFCEPAEAAKLKQYANRAAVLHNVRIRYGTSVTVTPEFRAKRPQVPEAYLGREIISFAVMDKVVRKVTVTDDGKVEVREQSPEDKAAARAAAEKIAGTK